MHVEQHQVTTDHQTLKPTDLASACACRLQSTVPFMYYSARMMIGLLIVTALHGMHTRSSDENYVCLSACPSVRQPNA